MWGHCRLLHNSRIERRGNPPGTPVQLNLKHVQGGRDNILTVSIGKKSKNPNGTNMIELLQRHQESIVKEAFDEITSKIPEYQCFSSERLIKNIHIVIDSIQQGLKEENDHSVISLHNKLFLAYEQTKFNLSLVLRGLNILKNIILKRLVLENHNNPEQLIHKMEAINGIYDQRMQFLINHHQGYVKKTLKTHSKELPVHIKKTVSDVDRIKQFNENILQSMTSGLIVVENQNYTIVKFNKAMEAVSGIPASQAVGKNLEEAFHYIDGIPFEHFYNEIKSKGKVERLKLKLKRDSGEEIYRYIKADVLYDNEGNSTGIMIIIDDVTESEVIKESFSRYVAHQVVERILNGTEKVCLSGIRKEVTVLFADLRDFTALSENSEPELVVAILNDFFSLMVDVIFKYEGTLDKFIGDNIMAVFGAPVNYHNDPEKAVMAAVEMQNKTKNLNEKMISHNIKPLEIGIGINTGEAIAGNIGSEKRMDYTVIGDTVNFADRIQSVSAGGEILISEITYRKVKEKIAAEKLPPRFVKGKKKSVVLYKVLGLL